MIKNSISSYDDVISVDDLRDAVDELLERVDDEDDGLDDVEREELRVLSTLLAEVEDYGCDYLVRDSHFAEYVQELLEDCGDIPRDLPHYIVIDWEATAQNIQVDYTAFEFEGTTFWGR